MPIQEQTGIRPLESSEDFWETRLEAIGFIFHGILTVAKSKAQASSTTNLLHFARCPKLEKIGDGETKNLVQERPDRPQASGRANWYQALEVVQIVRARNHAAGAR